MYDMDRARIRLEQHKTNHILHLLLSFFTIGIWIIFWMMIASSNTTNRNVINRKYGLPEESNPVGSGCLLLIVLFIMGAVIGFVESDDPNETPSEDSFIDLAPNPFAYPQSEDSFIDLAPNPFTNSQGVKSVINQPVQQLAQTTDHNNSIVKHDVKSLPLTNKNVLKASCYDLKPDFNDCEYKANKGSSVAQYNLGKLYRAGTVVEQDFTKAILWFRKSSAQRNHKALNALRDMLHKKQGFSDDGVNESKENNRQVLHRSKIVQRRTTGDKTNKRELVNVSSSVFNWQELDYRAGINASGNACLEVTQKMLSHESKGERFISVACADGGTFMVLLPSKVHNKIRVLPCDIQEAITGVKCFERF